MTFQRETLKHGSNKSNAVGVRKGGDEMFSKERGGVSVVHTYRSENQQHLCRKRTQYHNWKNELCCNVVNFCHI